MRTSKRRSKGVSTNTINGAATTEKAAHTTSACHSHDQSCRVSASGAVRAAWKNTCGDNGNAAVPKTFEPSRINGITIASSSGNMAWFAICAATTFSRNANVTARQNTVVVPITGLIPINSPTAMLHASVLGVAPMRSRARIGSTPRR